jgi:hypothetical protein
MKRAKRGQEAEAESLPRRSLWTKACGGLWVAILIPRPGATHPFRLASPYRSWRDGPRRSGGTTHPSCRQ